MTHTEIEQQALSLPAADRAALMQALQRSLDRERLSSEELEALGKRLESEIAPWFEGESREMTAEDWARLRRGEYRHPPEPDSLATPPGWVSPRLKG